MIYAIGDIHGELRKLHGLLQKLDLRGLSPSDRLVFMGDYIDRGPDTPGVLDLLIRLREERPNTIFLRGNHDDAMLDAREIFDPERSTKKKIVDIEWWLSCGGRETIAAYGPLPSWYKRIPEAHWAFLEATTLEHREAGYIFVHAGLPPPGFRWREPVEARLWIRDPFIDSKADFGGTVIFGHTPQDLFMPVVMPNKVGVDTGAAYGGPLTAMVIDPKQRFDPRKVEFVQCN